MTCQTITSLIPSIISAIMSLITIIVSIILAIVNICISKKARKIQDKKEALNTFYYPLSIHISKINILYSKILKTDSNFSIFKTNNSNKDKQDLLKLYKEIAAFLECGKYYYINKNTDKIIDDMIKHIYMAILNDNVEGIFTNEELLKYPTPNWEKIIINIKDL